MSLARYNQQHAGNRENADAAMRVLPGKTRLATARTALGNVSNKASLHSQSQAAPIQKGLKETVIQKAKLGTRSSTARQRLHEKENPTAKIPSGIPERVPDRVQDVKLEPVKNEDAEVMDISGQGDQAFSKQLLPSHDIDKDDKNNPQLVSEYVNEIYTYMMELEQSMSVAHHYLDGLDINGRMRGILVDWLVQVHLRFKLLQETLYLTVSIIDRFLQVQEVSRNKLQLVGVTAMLLASKYEEMYAPEIADFVYITDNAYSKADIRNMECFMLRTLDFKLGKPLPLHFLRRYSKAGEVNANQHTLAKYLMEITIVDYEMVHHRPSQIAAAALCLSMKLLDSSSQWTDQLVYYSRYTYKEVEPVIQRMAVLLSKAGSGKLTAIKTKYTSSKFMRIASIPEVSAKNVEDFTKTSSNH